MGHLERNLSSESTYAHLYSLEKVKDVRTIWFSALHTDLHEKSTGISKPKDSH